jgi:hypothetical protein
MIDKHQLLPCTRDITSVLSNLAALKAVSASAIPNRLQEGIIALVSKF